MSGPMDWWPSTRKISWGLAMLWIVFPPLLLSALVHMADPDIDGWGGLVSSTVIWPATGRTKLYLARPIDAPPRFGWGGGTFNFQLSTFNF